MSRAAKEPARPRAPHQPELRCYRVSNLRVDTAVRTISDFFQRFGRVKCVELELNDNEALNGTALVQYRERPNPPDFYKKPITIDGRHISVEPVSNAQNHDQLFRTSSRGNRTRVQARSISLGVMGGPRTFIEEWTTSDDVAMIINYSRRQIQLYFNQQNEKYRLEFSFKDMTNGEMIIERKDNTTIFTIQLKFPAKYWRQNANAVQETKTTVTIGDQWERIVGFPLFPGRQDKSSGDKRPSPEPAKRHPVLPMVEPGMANLGMWTTYRIKFVSNAKGHQQFEDMLAEAAEYNLVPRNTRLNLPILTVNKASDYKDILTHEGRAKILSFDVLYMLESLILSQQICEYNLDEHFYNTIKTINPELLVGIFDILIMSKKRIWDPLGAITDIFNERGVKVMHKRKIPPHCALIRRITVTPTTMYIHPPQMETTNRVIRHFSKHADRFVRIQFVDDGNGRISASHSKLVNDAVYNRVYDVMRNGLQIGTRRYDFLAFSSAQLRDHGCWFFTPTADLGTNQIREWMGTFKTERNIAKHAVRMGQCFSSTRPITRLLEEEVEEIPDVVHNGYTFSDGVGNISPALAEEVAIKMDLKTVPSAFQFRFGGAKGVLTVCNDLKGRKIQLRKSQIKFESEHYMLEVIRVSTLIPAYLNRQAITLLSTLGVPDSVFMGKMEKVISTMNKMLGDPNEAIRTLMRNVDEFGTARSMARIIQAGFLEKRDPYIVNLINMFRISMLKDLKKKAKILVPKGAFLLGVMDETKTLEEGQVFCQISMSDPSATGPKRRIITGETVVFRNPCFHPGDVRVVNAVDVPQLRHLCDVLVFSSQGVRDIPSMCSGGDLDGDDYTIFWDPELIPKVKNYEPMDYKAEEPPRVKDVQIKHIRKFFVKYINNDNLGQIANAHLATADRSPNGALDGNCLRLAQLHSLAVDFPKSGRPADFESDLRVRSFPDFMQKKDKDMYESQKVLGKIFRAIDKSDYKDYKNQIVDNTMYDVRVRVDGMERYIAQARELKAEYDSDVLALMNQYGVQTEAELMSGYIVKWLKKGNRKSTHEIHKQTMTAVSNMKAKWRRRFDQEFFQEGDSVTLSREKSALLEAKASAWYYVTYHADEQLRNLTVQGKFLSFPWVVDEYICEIARKNNNRVPHDARAQPVDNALVERYSQQNSDNPQLKYSVIVDDDEENEAGDNGDDSHSNPSDDDDDTIETEVLSLRHLSLLQNHQSQQQQQQAPRPRHDNSDNHFLVNANATEEDLANVLLS